MRDSTSQSDRMVDRVSSHDWASTPLGPRAGWPQSLKTAVEIMLSSGHAMQIAWGPERTMLYNDAYAPMLGERHPDALGIPFKDAWPDVWDEIQPLVDRVFAGETVKFDEMPLVMTRHGYAEETWWSFSYSPLRDESGEVAGLLNVTMDVTTRVRTERAERERDEANARFRKHADRLRALINASSDVVYQMSADWTEMRELEGRGFVADTHLPSVRWIEEYLFPEDRAAVVAVINHAIANKTVFELEHRLRRADGSVGWTFSRAVPVLDADGAIIEWFGMAADITQRKQVEADLHAEQERQAFLLELNDEMRAAKTERGVAECATRLLAQELDLDRCYVTHMDIAGDNAQLILEYRRDELPSIPAQLRLSDFPTALNESLERTMVFNDIPNDTRLNPQEKQVLTAMQFAAVLAAPLRSGNRGPVWCLAAVSTQPREWTRGEIVLIERAAERIWARLKQVRAELLLRQNEERFRQFSKASSAALWLRNAETLEMEYVSPATRRVFGVASNALSGDVMHWATVIVPEDRAAAIECLERARRGEEVVHQYRIQRKNDQGFRWIRSTDFPLYGDDGEVQRIGGIAEDITDAQLAQEHQGVLLSELQHRVRNIMAMIRSMANRSAKGSSTVEEYRESLEGRLLALARVQTLLTHSANAGGSLREVIEGELSAQADHRGQFRTHGPDILLSPKAVEVLSLVFHELATNALKYGALSAPQGCVAVHWQALEQDDRPWIRIDWKESGVQPSAPTGRRGFGTELIEARVPYELGGSAKITLNPEGASCRIELPLRGGDSILETDAPTQARVFGGVLDMSGAPSLSGYRVLVVEDDYYSAADTASALRGAGAEVIGPCSSEDKTLRLLQRETPTHAVLDVNLGHVGPRFEIARVLKERSVPVVFLTGYDEHIFPEGFRHAPRLQKPISLRAIVEAVSRL